MRSAEAGNRFRYSTQHSVYISQGIRDFIQGLQEIEWVIWGVFCLSAKGWIEMEWSARRLVRQAIGRSGSDEAGGYVDDPLRGASALPPRSARWPPGSLGTRGMLAFAHIPAGPAATPMRIEAGEEEDRDRGARCRRAARLNAAAACR
jgi:hypothetical protein